MREAPVTQTGLSTRLPFYYGWVVVAVAFVTMGIGVNVRTAFSLLFPPILAEFGWERGVTAGAFSFGFMVSTLYAPFTGLLMDRWGPRYTMPFGVVLVSLGLMLATQITQPWHLYISLGALVVGSSIFFSYIGHSLFLPNWFVRRRGLAIGIAFSGVGVGSILLFPWLQRLIGRSGWRDACWSMALLLVVTLLPLNLLLQRRRPEDMGLLPDGDTAPETIGQGPALADNVVDPHWVAIEWTLRRAMQTMRFWWIFLAFLAGLFAWYAVQVHQTKYLIEIGFPAQQAATALGLVGLTGIVGQIALGYLSDRIGREWAWTLSGFGYVICYALLLLMAQAPTPLLLYLMVISQGVLGYGLASVFGAIPAEVFHGRHYGTIFGTLSLAAGSGAALGPWAAGALYDTLGNYTLAFWLAIFCSAFSIVAIWCAAPRKVRAVAGQVARLQARRARQRHDITRRPEPTFAPVSLPDKGKTMSIEHAKARFERTAFMRFLGVNLLSVTPERVLLQLPFRSENANPGGPLHGGATASLMNMAGTLLAWSGVDLTIPRYPNTVELTVQYLDAVMGDDLLVEATLLRRGRDLFFIDLVARDTARKVVSNGTMIYRAPHYGDQPMRVATRATLFADAGEPPVAEAPPQSRDFTGKLRMLTTHHDFGRVRLTMPYAETHQDVYGNLHEGALAALLDTAGTHAAWSMVQREGARGSTIGMQVNYTSMCREDVVAEARVQQRSEELFFAHVQICTAATQRLVAMGNVSYRLLEAR